MDSLELNSNIYGINASYPVFGRFTGNKPVSKPIKTPEIKDTFTKNNPAASDGKFSFFEYAKNTVIGSGEYFVDMAKILVKNAVEKPLVFFPMLAVTAAVASTPVGLGLLAGGGLIATAFSGVLVGVQSVSDVMNKKWDDLEKKGRDMGKLIPAAILSTVASINAIQRLEKAAGLTKFSGLGKTLAKAENLNDFFITITKDVISAPIRAVKTVFGKNNGNGILFKTLKNDWIKFVTGKSKVSGGNPIVNNLFRPDLREGLFTSKEINYLKEAVNNPISKKGFLDFTFGLGKGANVENSFQSMVTAIRMRTVGE